MIIKLSSLKSNFKTIYISFNNGKTWKSFKVKEVVEKGINIDHSICNSLDDVIIMNYKRTESFHPVFSQLQKQNFENDVVQDDLDNDN